MSKSYVNHSIFSSFVAHRTGLICNADNKRTIIISKKSFFQWHRFWKEKVTFIMFLFAFLFYSFHSLREFLPEKVKTFLNSHETEKQHKRKITSAIIETSNFDGVQQELPFTTKFFAAILPSYQKISIPKTKYKSWNIYGSTNGNYTIRFFEYYKLNYITFDKIPSGFDCSIKDFRIHFAKNGHVFHTSKVFHLKQDHLFSQTFNLAQETNSTVDAVKINVIENWGSIGSICLFNYSFFV